MIELRVTVDVTTVPAELRSRVAADALWQLAREVDERGLPYAKMLSLTQQTYRAASDEPATARLEATVASNALDVELDDVRTARDDYRGDRDRWHERATELREALDAVVGVAPSDDPATVRARELLRERPT